MAVDLALNLPPDTSAPGLARAAAKRYLGGKVGPERLSDLFLVISELVSNALAHGRGQVVFRLQLDEGIVRGEVIDEGGGFEHEIRARGPDDVSGRGLFLVEALTTRWGIHEGTTRVWFELAARSDSSGSPRPRLGQDERPEALDLPDGRSVADAGSTRSMQRRSRPATALRHEQQLGRNHCGTLRHASPPGHC